MRKDRTGLNTELGDESSKIGLDRRKRARETPALVDSLQEREAKDMMLRIAREYEELAKLTEQRLDQYSLCTSWAHRDPRQHCPTEQRRRTSNAWVGPELVLLHRYRFKISATAFLKHSR